MSTRVYDLPTRVFHWLFAFFFLVAFTISNTVDDESLVFSYHMISGLLMIFCLLIRIIWGVIGTQHAKFTDFSLNFNELIQYIKGIFSDSNKKWAGHNPASSWAALTMMLMALGLGFTGIMMTYGIASDVFEEIHELFANTFIIVVILHVSGVVIHQLIHKDSIAKSMVSGEKQKLPEHTPAVSQYLALGFVFFVMVMGFSYYLLHNFETQIRTLTVFGIQLQLTEAEENDSGIENNEHHEESKDDDD